MSDEELDGWIGRRRQLPEWVLAEIKASRARRSASTEGSGSALAVNEEEHQAATSEAIGDGPKAGLSENAERLMIATRKEMIANCWYNPEASDEAYRAAISKVLRAKEKEPYDAEGLAAAISELLHYQGSATPTSEAPKDDQPRANLSEDSRKGFIAAITDMLPPRIDDWRKAAIINVSRAEDKKDYDTAVRKLSEIISAHDQPEFEPFYDLFDDLSDTQDQCRRRRCTIL